MELIPQTPAEAVESNCSQVAFILRNKTRADREQVAEDQLRKAAATIRDLRMSLLLFGVKK